MHSKQYTQTCFLFSPDSCFCSSICQIFYLLGASDVQFHIKDSEKNRYLRSEADLTRRVFSSSATAARRFLGQNMMRIKYSESHPSSSVRMKRSENEKNVQRQRDVRGHRQRQGSDDVRHEGRYAQS